MRALSFLVLHCIATIAAFGSEVLLVTTLGKHATKDRKTAVEVVEVSPSGVRFLVHFDREGGRGWTGPKEDIAITPGRWAFWIAEPKDVWFYDGSSRFMLYEITARGITVTDSQAVPQLIERAPEVLKRWVERGGKIPKIERSTAP